MQNITILSEQLQNAVKAGDFVAVENCTKEIAKIVKEKEELQQKEKDKIEQEQITKKLIETAEKFPCLLCGGKLSLQIFPVVSSAVYSILFQCNDCKHQCLRNPDQEEDIQKYIKEEIANFKILIKRMIKIGKIKSEINDDLTQINGKPFHVFQRLDRPRCLAWEYDGHYSHESLQSGYESNWATNLLHVVESLGDRVFNLSYKDMEKLKEKVRNEKRKRRL